MTELYKKAVQVKFNYGSHRYTVSTDQGVTWDYKPGVTTVLNILSKPALMMWPLDEALKLLFGQTFEEKILNDGSVIVTPRYNVATALLKPDSVYSPNSLQDALEAARMAHTLKKESGADVGKEVHSAIELYLANRTSPELSREAQKSFDAFVKWFESQDIKVLASEQVVYSQAYGYCGTYDALFEIDGKKVLVDFKTSNASRTAPKGIYADHFIQLGGYAQAYEEEYGAAVDDVLVINCSKQGKVNTCYGSELDFTPAYLQNLFVKAFELAEGKKTLEKGLK